MAGRRRLAAGALNSKVVERRVVDGAQADQSLSEPGTP